MKTFETRQATDYEYGFVLRFLSEYIGGDVQSSTAMVYKMARQSIEKTRFLHANPIDEDELHTLGEEAITKFAETWEGELTVTDKHGKPMTIEASAINAFYYACRQRYFCYQPRATVDCGAGRPAEVITVEEFNRTRCEHRLTPRLVADKTGEVVATLSQSYQVTDDGYDGTTQAETRFYQGDPVGDRQPVRMEAGWLINPVKSSREDTRVSIEMIHDDPEWMEIGRQRMGVA